MQRVLTAAVAILGVLVVVERRAAEPMVPLHLYRNHTFRVCTIVTFIVGGYVRRWQETQEGRTPQKYSFIVHTETKKGAHSWQERIGDYA